MLAEAGCCAARGCRMCMSLNARLCLLGCPSSIRSSPGSGRGRNPDATTGRPRATLGAPLRKTFRNPSPRDDAQPATTKIPRERRLRPGAAAAAAMRGTLAAAATGLAAAPRGAPHRLRPAPAGAGTPPLPTVPVAGPHPARVPRRRSAVTAPAVTAGGTSPLPTPPRRAHRRVCHERDRSCRVLVLTANASLPRKMRFPPRDRVGSCRQEQTSAAHERARRRRRGRMRAGSAEDSPLPPMRHPPSRTLPPSMRATAMTRAAAAARRRRAVARIREGGDEGVPGGRGRPLSRRSPARGKATGAPGQPPPAGRISAYSTLHVYRRFPSPLPLPYPSPSHPLPGVLPLNKYANGASPPPTVRHLLEKSCIGESRPEPSKEARP